MLEQHGYPPLVMSLESVDALDHVIFIYRGSGAGDRWRDRATRAAWAQARVSKPRALALSYVDPYIDLTGRVKAYGIVDLRVLGGYDWRCRPGNVWKVERMLFDFPHRRDPSPQRVIHGCARCYRAYRAAHDGRKPLDYGDRERWTALPRQSSHDANQTTRVLACRAGALSPRLASQSRSNPARAW